MKLSELTPAMLAEAVEIYRDLAYASTATPRAVPDLALPADATPDDVLRLFHEDRVESEGRACRRYSLRLGNRNYPFMKLVLQEHIVPGEFFFAVDTHDDMAIKPDYPDYDAWIAVRRFNSELKRRIEASFVVRGLPTASNLRAMIGARGASSAPSCAGRILVVDDEPDLAAIVTTLLRARGYDVQSVEDGRAALDMVRADPPDMVLLDYELPEMDGLEVLARLRSEAATRHLPVLLCTASKIDVAELRRADGFLAKPYDEELLYQMVQRILAPDRARGGR